MLTTLRGKFLVLIVLPVLAALIGLTVISYLSARHYLLWEMKKAGVDTLKADAEDLQIVVVRMRTALEAISIAEQQGDFSDGQRKLIFARIQKTLGDGSTSLFMGFPDGRMVRSKKEPLPQGYDPRTRPWYKMAMSLPPGTLRGGTPPYPDSSTRQTVITLFQKVLDKEGNLLGVLALDLDVARMAASLKTRAGLPHKGIRFVVSNDALILVHPDASLVHKFLDHTGEPMDAKLAARIRDPQVNFDQFISRRAGDRWYMGFHRVAGTLASIVLMIPADEVLQPLNQLVWVMSLLSAVFTLIVVVLLLLITRRISQPVYALTDAAVKVVQENRYQDPLAVTTSDELGRLTEAFNFMMAGLRQRDFIRDTFGRYVTKEVVKALLDQPDGLRLGGEKKEVTIMFCDIRGFTPLSERLEPEQVVSLLNRYLGTMSALVAQHGGTVSEFVGDSILAFFGAPVEHEDSPVRAVACAVEMQAAMEIINRENAGSGLPELGIGIGISTGAVIVGNIGSEKRAKFGVVGREINLAARVESTTVGGQILISGSTYDKIRDNVIIKQERRYHLKGVEKEVTLYDVAGITFKKQLMVPEIKDNSAALQKPLEVAVILMKDKKEAQFAAKGRLTHFSRQWAKVSMEEEILPPVEIRLDLCNGGNLMCDAENIYARVVETSASKDGIVHLVRIAYVSPEAESRLGSAI